MLDVSSRFALNADRLLALAFVVVTQAEIWVFEADAGFALGVRIAVSATTLAASATLAWRRTRPAVAFWINSAAIVASIAVGFPSNFYQWTNLIVTYSVAAHGTARQAWWALPFSMGGVLFYFFRFPTEGGAVVAAFATAMWAIAWLAGRIYGARVEEARLRAERDVSVQLAQAREERLALEEARAAIARELHDVIGHSVNVMVVHAGAGRGAIAKDPDQAEAAFQIIEKTGRRALDELDRVLAVLRQDGPASLSSAPGLDRLPKLLETFQMAGLEVELDMNGDTSRLPTTASLNGYRIIQEALTNTLKHSNGRTARVSVEVQPGSANIAVADDGTVVADLIEGRGISGMRERASLHGGDLSIESGPSGVVVATSLHWEPS